MQSAVQKIQNKLMQPEVKKVGTEQIRTKARTSVLSKLAKAKITADQKNLEHYCHFNTPLQNKSHGAEH